MIQRRRSKRFNSRCEPLRTAECADYVMANLDAWIAAAPVDSTE